MSFESCCFMSLQGECEYTHSSFNYKPDGLSSFPESPTSVEIRGPAGSEHIDSVHRICDELRGRVEELGAISKPCTCIAFTLSSHSIAKFSHRLDFCDSPQPAFVAGAAMFGAYSDDHLSRVPFIRTRCIANSLTSTD